MATDTLAPGLRLADRYTLLRPLGRGGMSSVWAAETDAHLNVAVKLLTAELAQNDELVTRFFQEAHTASRIGHPGIVRVIDTGQAPWGAPFLVMEELVGLSLAELLARHGPFTPAQAVSVLVPMLDAVAAAHAAGVVHRDLKPDNVFITLAPTPAVKLLDFGISKVLTSDARLTGTGMVFGTPAYMAPEQVREARQATSSSDLYSVGVIAFELLTGRLPLMADNPLALASAVLTEQPPPLLSVRPELPVELGRLIDRALSKDPALRPPHAHVFKALLAERWPSDTRWLFERVHQLLGAQGAASPAAAPTLRSTRPRGRGEVSLALLVERRALPPELAVHVVCALLLDPTSPRTVAPGQVLIDADGAVRAAPGTPLKSVRGATLESYAAPEAWAGRASALSLQFSLGAVLLHALTRQAPFIAADEASLRAKLAAGAPALLSRLPPALAPVVQRMLLADPLQRYPDAGTCASELTAAVRTSPLFHRATEELAALTRAPPPAMPAVEPPPAPRSSARTPVLLALLLVVAGAAAWRLRATPGLELTPPEQDPAPLEAPPVTEPGPAGEPPPGLTEVVPKSPSVVQVTTTPPGAALWVEGEFRGNTPGTLTLPQGKTWHLRFELPGHEHAEATVNPDGRERSVSVALTPTARLGVVRFELPDGTRLWLDGALVAEGSLELPMEADVRHTLEVEEGGRRSAPQPLTVKAGERKHFRR